MSPETIYHLKLFAYGGIIWLALGYLAARLFGEMCKMGEDGREEE